MTTEFRDVEALFEETLDTENDLQLGFQWNIDPYITSRLGLTKDKKDVKRALIAELLIASERRQRLSYARRPAFYVERERYCGGAYTYRRILSAVAELVDAGYAETWIAPARSPRPGLRGTQSTLWATDKLITACAGEAVWPVRFEALWMRDRTGHTCDYTDDDQTCRLRAEVEEINEYIKSYSLDLRSSNVIRTERHFIIPHMSKQTGNPCNLYMRAAYLYLRRVFCRNSFDCGGRLYGSWQNLPPAHRKCLLINGEAVAEPDFECLHAQLLYAMSGGVMETGFDPYGAIDGFPRSHGKLAFLIGLNARNTQASICALAGAIQANQPDAAYDRSYAAEVMRQVKELNPQISQFLGADQGVRLQKIDGDLAVRVVRACMGDGIPVLPVHDSFIVPARFESRTREHMERELAETIRQFRSA